MYSEPIRLDGNAIAGALVEAFGTEMTAVRRRCPTCGALNAVGAYHLYRGAGLVLRCPVCSDIALTVAKTAGRQIICMHGRWTLSVERL